MKLFEIRMLHPHFSDAERALLNAFDRVPEPFQNDPAFPFILPTIQKNIPELALDLLEELTVGKETEFPADFWSAMEEAAMWLGLSDEEAYYGGMKNERKE